MKQKLKLLLSALIAAFLSTPAVAENWVSLSKGAMAEVFRDEDSIKTENGLAFVRAKIVFSVPMVSNDITFYQLITGYAINCNERTGTVTDTTLKTKNGDTIKSDIRSKANWVFDSEPYRLYGMVCNLPAAQPVAIESPKPSEFDTLKDRASKGDREAQQYLDFINKAYSGDAKAQSKLGWMYYNGKGVAIDLTRAAEWYQKAATQDDAEAQFFLGIMYLYGNGVLKDISKAVELLQKAAARGDTYAQTSLAAMYDNGEGVPKNSTKAVEWYLKAAAQGDDSGQFALGLHYMLGKGVSKDFVRGYAWLILAAAQGNEKAIKYRDSNEFSLTPEQLAEGQRLASSWKKGDTFKTLINTPIAQLPTTSSTENSASPKLSSSGSGIVVSANGYLLTNHHVANGCSNLKIRDSSKIEHEVTVVATDAKNDLALLKTNKPVTFSSATFRAKGSVEAGENVATLGYPLAGVLASEVNVSFGYVSATAGLADDTSKLQISAPVQPGNSGGPLLDQAGNLIGVVVAKLDAIKVATAIGDIPQNINFAIKGEIAQLFLNAHKVKFKTTATAKKLENTDIASRGRAFTVLVECYK